MLISINLISLWRNLLSSRTLIVNLLLLLWAIFLALVCSHLSFSRLPLLIFLLRNFSLFDVLFHLRFRASFLVYKLNVLSLLVLIISHLLILINLLLLLFFIWTSILLLHLLWLHLQLNILILKNLLIVILWTISFVYIVICLKVYFL